MTNQTDMPVAQDVEMIDVGSASDPDSAPYQAIKTPEILEAILLNLDGLQLFKIQSTSKAFRETIIGSPTLQRKMGMREPLDAESETVKPGKEPLFNTMLMDTIFIPKMAIQAGVYDGIHANPRFDGILHENLERGRLRFVQHHPQMPIVSPQVHYTSLANREASWRKVFVAQSRLPCFHTTLKMEVPHGGLFGYNYEVTESRSFHEGFVTMGELLDAVEEEYESMRVKIESKGT